jgi:hypothetical protein
MTRFAKLPPLAAALTLALGACTTLPPAANTPARYAAMPGADCFRTTDWQGWASPSDDVLYLRISANRYYRVDLLPGSGRIDHGGQFLINTVRGSDLVCSANDLDLKVASPGGFTMGLFPVAIRRLTDAEVAALPPGAKP